MINDEVFQANKHVDRLRKTSSLCTGCKTECMCTQHRRGNDHVYGCKHTSPALHSSCRTNPLLIKPPQY